MPRIAVLDDYQGVALGMADWRSLTGCEVSVFRDHLVDADALVARLAGFEIVVAMRERTPFPRALLERLPRLKLLVTTGMRNAAIDLPATEDHGVTVCGTPGLGYPTAELAWGLILSLMRRIPAEERALREGRWQTTIGLGLQGRTLGVLGLGNLGSRVAKIGRAFEMEVLAWSQNLTPERARDAGARLVPKDELLAHADVVTLHLVLSDRTRSLIGARELGLMKPGAHLVNTSRGPLVDQAAVIAALRSFRLGGYGVDVYAEEPLPMDDPLRSAPNVVMTPHLGYVTEETYRVFFGGIVDDIAAYLSGRPIRVLGP